MLHVLEVFFKTPLVTVDFKVQVLLVGVIFDFYVPHIETEVGRLQSEVQIRAFAVSDLVQEETSIALKETYRIEVNFLFIHTWPNNLTVLLVFCQFLEFFLALNDELKTPLFARHDHHFALILRDRGGSNHKHSQCNVFGQNCKKFLETSILTKSQQTNQINIEKRWLE